MRSQPKDHQDLVDNAEELTRTRAFAKSIPRIAWHAQGFTTLRTFAEHIITLRKRRAALTASFTDPIQEKIKTHLQKAFDTSSHLRRLAREAALDDGRGGSFLPVAIIWKWDTGPQIPRIRGELGHQTTYQRGGTFFYIVNHPSTREVAVPASWALARLRENHYTLATQDRIFANLQQMFDGPTRHSINYLIDLHPVEAEYLSKVITGRTKIIKSVPALKRLIRLHGPDTKINEFLYLFFLRPPLKPAKQEPDQRKPYKWRVSKAYYINWVMQNL